MRVWEQISFQHSTSHATNWWSFIEYITINKPDWWGSRCETKMKSRTSPEAEKYWPMARRFWSSARSFFNTCICTETHSWAPSLNQFVAIFSNSLVWRHLFPGYRSVPQNHFDTCVGTEKPALRLRSLEQHIREIVISSVSLIYSVFDSCLRLISRSCHRTKLTLPPLPGSRRIPPSRRSLCTLKSLWYLCRYKDAHSEAPLCLLEGHVHLAIFHQPVKGCSDCLSSAQMG